MLCPNLSVNIFHVESWETILSSDMQGLQTFKSNTPAETIASQTSKLHEHNIIFLWAPNYLLKKKKNSYLNT